MIWIREFSLQKADCDDGLTIEIAALRPTILIVEDEKAARQSLRMVMEAYGYQVKEYASGEEFVSDQPDESGCLILDVNLPRASGLEILRQLRAMGRSVPTVLVSGNATKESRIEAARLNALAFFDKPIDIDALLAAISSIDS